MDEAKITVIYDEGATEGTTYIGAVGFSLLIDVDGERTLFGTGRRERYLSNNLYVAEVEADSIDRVVVSHHHIDHWGALPALIRAREEKIDVFAPATAWGEKKLLGTTGMCFSESVTEKVNRNDVSGWVQLSEHLLLTAPIVFHSGTGYEIFAVLKTRSGPVLMTGCCHCGLDHVFEAVKDKFGAYPVAVIGGLHLGGKKDALADLYADYLQSIGCRQLYLNHCTGVIGIGRLRATLGLKGVNDFYVGQSLTFKVF